MVILRNLTKKKKCFGIGRSFSLKYMILISFEDFSPHCFKKGNFCSVPIYSLLALTLSLLAQTPYPFIASTDSFYVTYTYTVPIHSPYVLPIHFYLVKTPYPIPVSTESFSYLSLDRTDLCHFLLILVKVMRNYYKVIP